MTRVLGRRGRLRSDATASVAQVPSAGRGRASRQVCTTSVAIMTPILVPTCAAPPHPPVVRPARARPAHIGPVLVANRRASVVILAVEPMIGTRHFDAAVLACANWRGPADRIAIVRPGVERPAGGRGRCVRLLARTGRGVREDLPPLRLAPRSPRGRKESDHMQADRRACDEDRLHNGTARGSGRVGSRRTSCGSVPVGPSGIGHDHIGGGEAHDVLSDRTAASSHSLSICGDPTGEADATTPLSSMRTA